MMLFRTYKTELLVGLTIFLLLGGMFGAGYLYASRVYGAEISRLKATHEREAREQSEKTVKYLRNQAWVDELLTSGLLDAKSEISTTRERLERSIPDAVQKDGISYSGLGDSGLCLYKLALGYQCETTN